MYSINSFFLFLNIFSILFILRIFYNFFVAMLSNPPIKLLLNKHELIFFGLSVSYTLTYLIQL